MNVNFEPIIRGRYFLLGPNVKSISTQLDSIAKAKSWGKKCLEIMTIKGGGVRRLMEKKHLKFPFRLFSDLPNLKFRYPPGHQSL